ncbi:MAG: TraB/GumN family protein [Rouxiella aceris]|uniref:TraB/GumN family protein n=1 Tax=Rouxiella aceris TaxID=2703884 RepID=UPI00284A3F5F|nr:TraB/GumN family protein [Rouxiella aceris]MDR3432545.1 TraB/GumN family protein [Rouxiella aceris]
MISHLFNRLARWFGKLSPAQYPYPAVDVSLPGGRYFHLVGSIHMGTQNMAPLPRELTYKMSQADALIVEADIVNNDSPFGQPDDLPPLSERVNAEQYEQIERLCEEMGTSLYRLASLPCWQIALTLQAVQAQRLGLRGEYGIDFQLLTGARTQGKKVIELEGAQQQLTLLQQLPNEGRSLLEDTLTHWHTNARLLQTMIGWWLERRPSINIDQLPATFGNTLYDVLMHQRNKQWQQQLEAMPAGNYVVAVGALHLYGEGNLPGLLKQTPLA